MASLLYWFLLELLIATCFKRALLETNNRITLSSSNEVVLENTSVSLTCSTNTEGQWSSLWESSLYDNKLAQCLLLDHSCRKTSFLTNNPLFDCICNDNMSYTVYLKHVDRFQHGSKWTCKTLNETSNTVVINVSVPVTHATLTNAGNEQMYENKSILFNCSSYSLPSPQIYWYRSYKSSIVEVTDSQGVDIKRETHTREDNVISAIETLTYMVNRSIHGWSVYCNATNGQDNVVTSDKVNLSVIYPPNRPPVINELSNKGTYRIIENDKGNLSCSVEGGNPLAKPEWHCERIDTIALKEHITNNEKVTSYLSWVANRADGKTCTCETGHVLSNVSVDISIDVLYPPGVPNIELQLKSQRINVTSDIKLIEHKSYTMLCNADANPPPFEYIWKGPQTSNISYNNLVNLTNVNRAQNGTYICHARNVMNPTNGGNCTNENNNSVSLDILFKPTAAVVSKQNVAEGLPFNITCKANSANPSNISYTWTSDAANFYKNSKELIIPNVSRHDAMTYTCTVKNSMEPTVGDREEGSANQTFFLNVWYRASVEQFYVNGHKHDGYVEVNESNSITFTCEVDSNPNSTVKIIAPNGTEYISEGVNVFEHIHFLSSCFDNGTYTCTARNGYNEEQAGREDVPVIVKCTPLAVPGIETDIRGKLHSPITLQFRAVAYPEPVFTWEKWANTSWKPLTNGSMFYITSHELLSNLTVVNFTSTTTDSYRLLVTNEIGTFIQHYSLKPYDRPETPLEFSYIKELLTDTSVTLLWKPGFNGGISQTFIIMYRGEEDKDWNNETVQETDNAVMNLTVQGLSSDTSYTIQLFAVNIEGRSENVTLFITTKGSDTVGVTKPNSKVGLIVGSISGVAFVALGAVIGILVYRKRFSSSRNENESSKLVYQNVPFSGKIPKKKQNPAFPPKEETSFQALQELDDAPPLLKEPTEYCNSPAKIEQFERIQVSELLPFVLGSSEESFGIEYQKLPTELQKPCVFARKPENIALNRYNGIYPYDHSRVKISGNPDFFINACYIDGYAKQNEYIASLGPTAKVTYDFKTFWMMLWSEGSDIIIMLTNLKEPSGMKCERYWPQLGTTKTYGDIEVICNKEDAFAEYTARLFTVSNAEERRNVTHLHYTAWPDKKVPEDVTTLLEFRQKLKITPSTKKGPIIVHCSAGIGRTGTLIALDRLIQEGQCESSVDVFKCVNSMREQRVKMVQTLEQYIYIYKALVNSLYFDSEMIPIESFQEYVDQTNNNIYSRQFQQLKDSVEKCGKEEHDARARNKMLVDKNRIDADIPGNQFRVYLYQNRSMDMSDYINAVYVSSFKRKDHFILAQSPLPDTVSDFVCMMYQENCCCVVTMEDLHKPGMSVGQYLPTDGQSQRFGDIKMSCRTLEMKPQYTVRELKMQNSGKIESQEKVAYHFQYNKWMPGNDTPADTKGFVQFIKNVEEYADQLGGENFHVLVHCLKANERSALYSIVTILTEKIHYERQVSVLNTVRHLRTRRRTAITSMEQLKFCYNAVKAYIDMFES